MIAHFLPRRRRLWLLYGCFGLFLLFVLFWFPRRDIALFRAMPFDSALIIDLQDPVANVCAALANPAVARGIDEIAGAGSAISLTESAELQTVLGFAAPHRVVLAWAPYWGTTDRGALLGASYLGWRSRIVELSLVRGRFPGIGALERSELGGQFAWIETPAGMRKLSVASNEGVLLFALSDDADAAALLSARIEQNSVCSVLLPEEPVASDGAVARAWVMGALARRLFQRSGTLAFSVSCISATALEGTMSGPGWCSWLKGQCERRGDAGRLGDGVAARAVFPEETLLSWLERLFPGVVAMMGVETAGDVELRVMGEPYEGRIQGLRTPALTAVVGTTVNGDNGGDWLPVLLDRINGETGARLFVRRLRGTRRQYVLDAQQGPFRDAFAESERFGVVLADDQIVLGSCAESLQQWEQQRRSTIEFPTRDVAGALRCALRADIPRLHTEAAHLLSVARLESLASGAGAGRVTHGLARAEALLGAAVPLKALDLTIRRVGRNDQLWLRLGARTEGELPQNASEDASETF